jgi:hypothetical protein
MDAHEMSQIVDFLSVADSGKTSKFWIGLNDLVTGVLILLDRHIHT